VIVILVPVRRHLLHGLREGPARLHLQALDAIREHVGDLLESRLKQTLPSLVLIQADIHHTK